MSEVRLVIRDVRRDIYADCHGSFAEAVVAGLSDEPESIEQLEAALERFQSPVAGGFFRGFHLGLDDQPYDAGVVIIDLAARLVVCQSTYVEATTDGCVLYHDGKSATDVRVRYHLSEDWLITGDVESWRGLAEQRRQERMANPPLDARGVLYGQEMLEFIARETLEAFRGEQPQVNDSSEDPIGPETPNRPREIHARWLTTPRDSLRGQAPRDVLLARREYIAWNLQDRAELWSQTLRPPRPLDISWSAYRFGGFGTHEIVTYYDLVRELIWSCREQVAARTGSAGTPDLTAAEFLETELPRLAKDRDKWLDRPDPDFHGRTPRSIIQNERIRMPEAVSGEEAVVDDDCPLCQMQADMPGVGFWHLDGCNMDDDFAFSFHRTYEEWQEEQREHEEWKRRFEAERAERERLGVKPPGNAWISPEFAWDERGKSPGEWLFLRLFTIGSMLCELTVSLKHSPEPDGVPKEGIPEQRADGDDIARSLIDRLSRDFGNLREVCQSKDTGTVDALIEPVLSRFRAGLDDVAAARPDLEEPCSALQDRLAHFLEPPPERDDSEPDDFEEEDDFEAL